MIGQSGFPKGESCLIKQIAFYDEITSLTGQKENEQ